MENDLIKTHHVLLLGALKRCHIFPQHPLFEDYLQQARLELVLTHRLFTKTQKDWETFPPYVFQRICWQITDELRKEQRQTRYTDTQDLTQEYLSIPSHLPTFDSDLTTDAFLQQLVPTLTTHEYLLLKDLLAHDLSISDIAKKQHVSRQTIYQRKKAIQKKYHLLNKIS